ncbi:hypothetical protein ACQ4PT_056120 [Festuca glaucescens]
MAEASRQQGNGTPTDTALRAAGPACQQIPPRMAWQPPGRCGAEQGSQTQIGPPGPDPAGAAAHPHPRTHHTSLLRQGVRDVVSSHRRREGRPPPEACKDPGNPQATGHQVRGRAAPSPSHSSPPIPSTETSSSEEHEDEQQQQAAASLPEDALIEIVSRVPYRSLRRFRCVSKPWLALCSDSKIRGRCPQTLSGFFHSGLRDIKFHNLLAGGFDAAVPSRFVLFVPQSSHCDETTEVAIYSSQTGRWISVQNEWGDQTILLRSRECVFVNGTMHVTTLYSSVATVDAEGKVWRKIKLPYVRSNDPFAAPDSTGHSQGRFYAWQINNDGDCQLYVWVLEDYDSGKWTLKHTVDVLELFGRHHREDAESYNMFAIHPECNLIFLTDGKEMAVSYDMDDRKVNVICTSGEFAKFGGLPYTPCFAE